MDVNNQDLVLLKQSCFYIGKGSLDRKFHHSKSINNPLKKDTQFSPTKPLLNHLLKLRKKGQKVVILQLQPEVCHYEAHSRKFALIKAIGLKNVTNKYNGTAYIIMKLWNNEGIFNFGTMIFYNALKM